MGESERIIPEIDIGINLFTIGYTVDCSGRDDGVIYVRIPATAWISCRVINQPVEKSCVQSIMM